MDKLENRIEEYIEYGRYRKRLDKKTLKSYRTDLMQYALYCTDKEDFASRGTVDGFLTKLHKEYKPKSVKRKIASLKAFFRHLKYKDLITEDPFEKLDIRFREPKLLPRTIPLATIQKFLDAIYMQRNAAESEFQRKCCVRDIAVMELLFATGMRISELCALKPSDIDLREGTVRIYGKGAKERVMQIGNGEVLVALRAYASEFETLQEKSGYFFVNRLESGLSDQSVRNMINKYASLAGIPQHLTPHMFRHSFATLMLEQDVDVRYIQRMLGHSSISTTEIYTHVSDSKQKEILTNKHPRNLMKIGGNREP